MATVQNRDDDENAVKDINGPASASTNTSTNSGASTTDGGSLGNVNKPLEASPQENTGQVLDQNKSFDFSPLMQFVDNTGRDAKYSIAQQDDIFKQGLGAKPTFGADQQKTFDDVISGGSPLSAGQAILKPADREIKPIGNSIYDPLVQNYNTQANETSSQNGVSTLLGQLRPDLTPGERAFDAMTYTANPNFRSASQSRVTDAYNTGIRAADTTKAATDAIPQRATDNASFVEAAKQYLGNKLTGFNDQIKTNIQGANTGDEAVKTHLLNILAGKETATPNDGVDLTIDPTTVASQYNTPDHSYYSQAVKPSDYYTFVPGQVADRNNTSDAAFAGKYNNLEQLLENPDRLTPSTRSGAHLGIDSTAFKLALNKALGARDEADLAHEADLKRIADEAAAAARLQNQPVPVAATADASGDGTGTDGGASDSGSSGGGDTSADGAGAWHKGGLIGGRKNFEGGGYVPLGKAPDAKIDDVPAAVDQGEFVTNRNATNAAGIGNMQRLNQMNRLPPNQQAAIRAALSRVLQVSR